MLEVVEEKIRKKKEVTIAFYLSTIVAPFSRFSRIAGYAILPARLEQVTLWQLAVTLSGFSVTAKRVFFFFECKSVVKSAPWIRICSWVRRNVIWLPNGSSSCYSAIYKYFSCALQNKFNFQLFALPFHISLYLITTVYFN